MPYVVLLIDGWEGFTAAYDEIDSGRPIEMLQRVIREGPAAGVSVVIAGDRAALTARVPSSLPERIALPLADRADYALLGIRARQVPRELVPGRGLLADSGIELQIATVSADPSGAAQSAALQAIGTTHQAEPGPLRGPVRLPPLPERVTAAALPVRRTRHCTGTLEVVLGLGGDDGAPVTVDLVAAGPGLLVAGPPGSGRTTALRRIVTALLSAGTAVTVVAPRRSPLRRLAPHPLLSGPIGPDDADRLTASLRPGRSVVVVDDLETVADDRCLDLLVGILRADDGSHAVIGSGGSDELLAAFRGLGVALRGGSCVLLQPAAGHGELAGVRLPRRAPEPIPGRGVLVVRRVVTPVQIGYDEEYGEPTRSAGVTAGPQRRGDGGGQRGCLVDVHGGHRDADSGAGAQPEPLTSTDRPAGLEQ